MPQNVKRTAFPIYNGYGPAEGAKILPLTFDFSSVASYSENLLIENTEGVIQFVQSVFVDNSDNTNPLVILIAVTNQRLIVPANAQGIWPIFTVDQTRFTISTTPAANLSVNVSFANVPMPFTQWGPTTVNNSTALVTGSYTDYSGTITVGGASQAAIPANGNRKGYFIQNPISATEPLYVNFTDPASSGGDSIELLSGQLLSSDSLVLSLEQINVVAATGAHSYIAKELA